MEQPSILDRVLRTAIITVGAAVALVYALVALTPGPGSHVSHRLEKCMANLQKIARALARYECDHHRFPAVGVIAKNGKPVPSWRIAILPYLGEKDLFDKYDPAESWSSLKNRQIGASIPSVYCCPADPSANQTTKQTSYVMIAGKGGLGGLGDDATGLDSIPRPDKTILVIEVPGSGVHWMDPRDLSIDEVVERLKQRDRGGHPGMLVAVFCDGHIDELPQEANFEATLRELANPNRR
jgi:hypothetical protein